MILVLLAPGTTTVRLEMRFNALLSVLHQFSLQLSLSVSACLVIGAQMVDPVARVSLGLGKHSQGVLIAPIRWQPTVPLVSLEVTQISQQMAHLAPCVLQALTWILLGIWQSQHANPAQREHIRQGMDSQQQVTVSTVVQGHTGRVPQ